MKISNLTFVVLGLAVGSLAALQQRSPNPGVDRVKRELDAKLYRRDDYYGYNDTDCEYASVAHIEEVWNNLYNNSWGGFFRNFHDEIDWTVMYTQPLSGHYTNVSQFIVNGVVRLLDCFDGDASFQLINLVGGCNNPWSVQETLVGGVAKNGKHLKPLNLFH